MIAPPKEPDYSVDEWGHHKADVMVSPAGALLLAGPPPLLLGAAMIRWSPSPAAVSLGWAVLITGSFFLAEALLMIRSNRTGKLAVRDRVLDALGLAGNEVVLDLGCGHGLFLIGAAKRLLAGRAVGIDFWSTVDQKDNRREATLANASLEGVADRVELHDGDMRTLPFSDDSFDVVTACLAIHNIADRDGRRQAVAEAYRVLKPGGKIAFVDFAKTAEYAADLRVLEAKDVACSGLSFQIFPPVRIVTARK